MNIKKEEIQSKLTKNLLDLIVMELLCNSPMHGYQIIATIRRSFGLCVGASTIYPLLSDLEEKKFVKPDWNVVDGRPRKTFKLTTQGKIMLDYTEGSLRAICKTMGTDKQQGQTAINRLELDIAQSPQKGESLHLLDTGTFSK